MNDREKEHAKYVKAYSQPQYRMGDQRFQDASVELAVVADIMGCGSWSYLDVGCGRGEMLRKALALGFLPITGLEVVPDLCTGYVQKGEITAIPFVDGHFDVVTCFDVLEHLPPADTVRALCELHRVAKRVILATANNRPSKLPDGTNLHINIRNYAEWDQLMREHWPGDVEKRPHHYVSEMWRCVKQ